MEPNELKTNNKYYFSVDGETEELYLDHLQQLINNCDKATKKVKLVHDKCSVTKKANKIPAIYSVRVFHLCDYESNSAEHVKNFQQVLKDLRNVSKINKCLKYGLGYSNFTFELWIVLHKKQLKSHLNDRTQYLKHINEAFGENFESLDEYKKKENFKKVLAKITLDDVVSAIDRADEIRDTHEKLGEIITYGDFKYCKENPDLTVQKCVREILEDCGIITKKKDT